MYLNPAGSNREVKAKPPRARSARSGLGVKMGLSKVQQLTADWFIMSDMNPVRNSGLGSYESRTLKLVSYEKWPNRVLRTSVRVLFLTG